MKISLANPIEGYLIIRLQSELEEQKSKSGLILSTKNSQEDNMLVYGEVVKAHGTSQFKPQDNVIFHVVELEAGFKDQEEQKDFYFIHERNIIGLYGKE